MADAQATRRTRARPTPTSGRIKGEFDAVVSDSHWSFAHLTTAHTRYATHGYHTYPAKFIPQLAGKLIEEYTEPGSLVVDPFMGSGTSLVEAKLQGRPSVGVDINPAAHLITIAKTTVVRPDVVEPALHRLAAQLQAGPSNGWPVPDHERIDYWFDSETKRTLARILHAVERVSEDGLRALLRCVFSNSLKRCSIWLQRSVKPTRDFGKEIPDPVDVFLRRVRQMAKRNAEFYGLLEQRGHLDVAVEPRCEDARSLPVEDGSVSLAVTSPPYVTSYEYADLHQLTALWFRYMTDLPSFRKQFIGTAHHEEKPIDIDSSIGEEIVDALSERHPRKAAEVATYFTDMREVFAALKQKLQRRGRACIVVGNTNLVGVDILNAQVFAEQMTRMGFELEHLIDREIPSKTLPQVRDKRTGRFTGKQTADYQAYPHEYILVMRKR